MGKAALLGVYVPIVLCAAVVCALLVARWLLPALSKRRPLMQLYLGFSSLSAMAAHLTENSVYGLARWLDHFDFINTTYPLIIFGKLLILASVAFAMAALFDGQTTTATLGKAIGVVLGLWALGTAAALVLT